MALRGHTLLTIRMQQKISVIDTLGPKCFACNTKTLRGQNLLKWICWDVNLLSLV